MKRNYVIPFFILHKGCPHQCIFCDQNRITGQRNIHPEEDADTIERYLSTIPSNGVNIEVGFFGGTFTGLAAEAQEGFLRAAYPFIAEGRVRGIRLSTRPDFIDKGGLELLRRYGVVCVELGVQSMSDRVLSVSRRGYTALDVERASRMILKEGFMLGHQIMVGLPSSRPEHEYYTARRARELGASQIRIYPLIVIKGTELAEWWTAKRYEPLKEEDAVERCMRLILYFEAHNVKVIRCGLHPSEGLLNGSDYLAGPFHPSLRQKVESRIFAVMLERLLPNTGITAVLFNPGDEAALFGFQGKNSVLLHKISGPGKAALTRDIEVPRGCLRVTERQGERERVFTLDRKQAAEQTIPELLSP